MLDENCGRGLAGAVVCKVVGADSIRLHDAVGGGNGLAGLVDQISTVGGWAADLYQNRRRAAEVRPVTVFIEACNRGPGEKRCNLCRCSHLCSFG